MAFYMNMMALNEARTKEEYEAEKKKRQEEQNKKDMARSLRRADYEYPSKDNADKKKIASKVIDGMINRRSPMGSTITDTVDAITRRERRKHESAGIFDECYFLDEE